MLYLLPIYGWTALSAIVLVNLLVYYGSKAITRNMTHYNVTTSLDQSIPFVPAFIIVYIVVAYAQWWYGYFLSAREKKSTVMMIFGSEIIAKMICMIIFLIFPTTMNRGIIDGNDIFTRMVSLLYLADTPYNLFPSIHCIESYLLWRTLPMLRKAPRWYRILTPPATLLVFASVVLVKQHMILDILGSVAVTEISLLAMRYIMTARKKIRQYKLSPQRE